MIEEAYKREEAVQVSYGLLVRSSKLQKTAQTTRDTEKEQASYIRVKGFQTSLSKALHEQLTLRPKFDLSAFSKSDILNNKSRNFF